MWRRRERGYGVQFHLCIVVCFSPLPPPSGLCLVETQLFGGGDGAILIIGEPFSYFGPCVIFAGYVVVCEIVNAIWEMSNIGKKQGNNSESSSMSPSDLRLRLGSEDELPIGYALYKIFLLDRLFRDS